MASLLLDPYCLNLGQLRFVQPVDRKYPYHDLFLTLIRKCHLTYNNRHVFVPEKLATTFHKSNQLDIYTSRSFFEYVFCSLFVNAF